MAWGAPDRRGSEPALDPVPGRFGGANPKPIPRSSADTGFCEVGIEAGGEGTGERQSDVGRS